MDKNGELVLAEMLPDHIISFIEILERINKKNPQSIEMSLVSLAIASLINTGMISLVGLSKVITGKYKGYMLNHYSLTDAGIRFREEMMKRVD